MVRDAAGTVVAFLRRVTLLARIDARFPWDEPPVPLRRIFVDLAEPAA